MNDDHIISQLTQLKQVTPNKQWVSSTKAQIIGNTRILHLLPSFLYNKQIAYSLAVLLFAVFGGYIFSLITYPSANPATVANTHAGVALLEAEVELKENFKILAEKSKNLAETIEREPQKVDSAIAETKVAVRNVTETLRKEPELTKNMALEVAKNRTYLTIAGDSELKETSDDLYKIVIPRFIESLDNLNEEGKQSLEGIKALYESKQYALAFENLVMLNAKVQSNSEAVGE